jgi:hypothetical protein
MSVARSSSKSADHGRRFSALPENLTNLGKFTAIAVKDREPMHQFAFALRLLQEN